MDAVSWLPFRPRRPDSIFVNIYRRFEVQNIINLSMCHAPRD